MIILFSGSSGVGKNAVICGLLTKHKNWKLFKSLSTREPRATETAFSSINYITKPEFESKIENNELIEYELIHSNYYGIEKVPFYDALTSETVYLKDVGVLGQENLMKFASNSKNLISIYLTASKTELKERLLKRGDTSNIEERLSRYEFEFEYSKNYDLVLQNDILDTTISQVDEYIKSRKEN